MKSIEQCYLISGNEEWTKNIFIKEIKNEILMSPDDIMNLIELEGKDVLASQIIDACETMPFFAERKIVYVKDGGFAKTGKKDETEKLTKWLESVPNYVVLILDESEVDKRNQLYKKVKNKYTIMEFNYPGEEEAIAILTRQAKEFQLSIDRSTLTYFVRNMPENLHYMIKEFEKLLDYSRGENITISQIDQICVFSLEQQVFQLVREVVNRNTSAALKIYHTLMARKESPIGVLVLIARQYRIMLQVKYLAKNHVPEKTIASQVGMPSFAVKEAIRQSSSYTFRQLQEILEYCLESDKALKTGKLEAIKCIELLIVQCIYIGEISK